MKNGTVFSIANQKGGIGKTTSTILVSTLINEICKTQNQKFCIIDVDFQHSISNARKAELNALKASDPNYNDGSLFPIFEIDLDLPKSKSTIKTIISNYDYIMVELPGTIDFINSDYIYSELEYIFIPVFRDDLSYNSTVQYISKLIVPMLKDKVNFKLKNFYWFFNKYNKRSYSKYDVIEEMLEDFIPNRKMENNIMESEELVDTKSTIFPLEIRTLHKPSQSIKTFTYELLKKITSNA